MHDLTLVAPAFTAMAHRIVWCTAATVDGWGRPRSRILHPFWEWDGNALVGWVATGPTPLKRAHLEKSPFMSCSYWNSEHDTCTAEVRATWHFDAETRSRVWTSFAELPPPLGYDPAIIPAWESSDSDAFAVLRLDPWLLRVMPGSVLMGQGGETLLWSQSSN